LPALGGHELFDGGVKKPESLALALGFPARDSCVDGRDFTTEVINTHRTGIRKLLYRWHPLYGKELTIQGERNRHGAVMFVCSIDEDSGGAFLEVPAWMFDAATCCRFESGSSAHVDVYALRSLRALLDVATTQAYDVIKAQHQFNVSGGSDAQTRKENDDSIPAVSRSCAESAVAMRSQSEASPSCCQPSAQVRRPQSNRPSCSGGES
jgi:hypothetical protein